MIKKSVPLTSLGTFCIGGICDYVYEVRSAKELLEAIRWAKWRGFPYEIVGAGSNIVFPDEGLRKMLIRYVGGAIERKGNTLTVEAGASLQDVIKLAVNHGLQGLETLSGIPGTLGGAMVGNAGAYGHSIS